MVLSSMLYPLQLQQRPQVRPLKMCFPQLCSGSCFWSLALRTCQPSSGLVRWFRRNDVERDLEADSQTKSPGGLPDSAPRPSSQRGGIRAELTNTLTSILHKLRVDAKDITINVFRPSVPAAEILRLSEEQPSARPEEETPAAPFPAIDVVTVHITELTLSDETESLSTDAPTYRSFQKHVAVGTVSISLGFLSDPRLNFAVVKLNCERPTDISLAVHQSTNQIHFDAHLSDLHVLTSPNISSCNCWRSHQAWLRPICVRRQRFFATLGLESLPSTLRFRQRSFRTQSLRWACAWMSP
eukprot:m.887305 g.887305  ORF g.887305 m.887305 type:complete len:298 (-) comp59917_c0_seq16:4724-5617(-)